MTENNRPLLYHEWRRQNRNGNRNGYQAYLNEMGWGNGDPLVAKTVDKLYGDDPEDERRFTHAEVMRVLNRAANLVQDVHGYETSETIAIDDAVDLTVSTAGYLLNHPGASLPDAIIAEYTSVELDENDMDEGEEIPDEGSQRWNELLVNKVLRRLP